MREGVVVALAFGVILTTGCVGVFGESQGGMTYAEFTTNNSTSEPYTFEVFVLDRQTEVRYVYDDGSSFTGEVQGGLHVAESDDGYRDVQPQSGQHYGNFTLNGSESVLRDIEMASDQNTILTVVYDRRGGIIGYVSANCPRGAPHSFSAIVDTDSVSGLYGC